MSVSTEDEQQTLLSSSTASAATPSTNSHTTTSKPSSSNTHREPKIHYSSLSVDCLFPNQTTPKTGSAQIVETDIGTRDDFWNIHVHLQWKPRGLAAQSDATIKPATTIKIPINLLLTVRVCIHNQNPPNVILHIQGGKFLAQLSFPNGPDAAMAFIDALRVQADLFSIDDMQREGALFRVEARKRMRRIVPEMAPATVVPSASDEDYVGLLQDLSLGNHKKRGKNVKREVGIGRGDLGMMILSQFARVTQAAREVGEDISVLLDEKKRREEVERKERERDARRRALDIYDDIVASTNVERELPPRLTLEEARGVPVGREVWEESFDAAGILTDGAVLKQAIFAGGVDDDIREQVWPFLLDFYPWESSQEQRDTIAKEREADYMRLKEKWMDLRESARAEDTASLEKNPDAISVDRRKRVSITHASYLETEEQIAKDIVRTDRLLNLYKQDDAPATLVMGTLLNVYAIYDGRITYCQGMSDFLSPLIYVLGTDNQALVFWCFESLMRRIEANFRIDQSGMSAQLSKLRELIQTADENLASFFGETDPDFYCCFRWLLVRFKRELPFDANARMWEVLWSRQVGGDDFHIFVAGALLLAHRRHLLALPTGAFDSLLRYINDMSMRIDVDFALREGELCYRKYSNFLRWNDLIQ
eukprot:GFKZ01002811.1.p1 GENE.GFKZ01002811.1~~GFKZ01002811.1.p1  ORF type:complete len:651 (+),score=117.44 GFKZ01002811.1:114-2066(+)